MILEREKKLEEMSGGKSVEEVNFTHSGFFNWSVASQIYGSFLHILVILRGKVK